MIRPQGKICDTDRRNTPFTKREQRHIAKEILEEHRNVYPTDSEFWTEFFRKTELDIF